MQNKITIADYFADHLSLNTGVLELETGIQKSYSKIYKNSLDIAAGLQLDKGERLTVILNNSCAWIEYFLASMIGGWIFNPVPYFVQVQELEKILKYINPEVLITDRDDIHLNLANKYKVIKTVV